MEGHRWPGHTPEIRECRADADHSRELVEFSATIPASTHLADGGKTIMREVARRLPGIPDAERLRAVPPFSPLRRRGAS